MPAADNFVVITAAISATNSFLTVPAASFFVTLGGKQVEQVLRPAQPPAIANERPGLLSLNHHLRAFDHHDYGDEAQLHLINGNQHVPFDLDHHDLDPPRYRQIRQGPAT